MAKNTNPLGRLLDRRRKPAKNTERVIAGVRKAFDDLGDRAAGGPEKRRIAGKKAAATRKRNATKRTAKKGGQEVKASARSARKDVEDAAKSVRSTAKKAARSVAKTAEAARGRGTGGRKKR
jgi:hypothetical protein